jgi:hypothetical protein
MPAFLPAEPPPAAGAREYLLDGVYFDERPEITIDSAPDGAFERMEVRWHSARRPMVLRRLHGEDAEAARGEAVDTAFNCRREDIAKIIAEAPVVLEWEIERSEMTDDDDPWVALHCWQVWMLKPVRGYVLAPGDGLFDCELQRRCGEDGRSYPEQ